MATTRGNARKNKNDEFYTEFSDIEYEIQRYKEQFENKIVLCNCDDPYESNFFLFFALNFKKFKLKRLISTCYSGSKVTGTQLSLFDFDDEIIKNSKAYKYVLDNEINDLDGDGVVTYRDVEIYLKKHKPKKLKGDGDFRSDECIELLKSADIIVTNPPFSLFREYVSCLFKYNKKFIIIGNINALSYKEFFPLFKDNKVWFGYNKPYPKKFRVVGDSTAKNIVVENGIKYAKMGNCCWYTNLETSIRHEFYLKGIETKYDKKKYDYYENFNGININSLSEIPKDFKGIMGVPLGFAAIYNPDEFEIIGLGAGELGTLAGVKPYDRKLKKKSAALRDGIPFILKDGEVKVPFIRMFVRIKEV